MNHIKKLKCNTNLIKHFSAKIITRHMWKASQNKIMFSLTPKIPLKFFARQPSFVAQGTLIHGSEYSQILKILTWHNNYLFYLDFMQDLDHQTFKFYRDIMFVNPKFFQHIMSILYPNAQYSLITLKQLYPNIFIDSSKLYITEDVVVTATATDIMQKAPVFSKGNLAVLACEYNPKEKMKPIHEKALMQTNQKHPDFLYNAVYKLNNKNNLVWERFYDWKTGKIEINSGHVLCFSNLKDYEYEVPQLLNAQAKKYSHISSIKNELNNLFNDKSLTWANRNTKFQAFITTILHEHPDINPSFILYNPLLYEIDNKPIPSILKSAITTSSFENIEKSEEALAKAIMLGGTTCQENYIKHPYKSTIIVGLIKELLNNYT